MCGAFCGIDIAKWPCKACAHHSAFFTAFIGGEMTQKDKPRVSKEARTTEEQPLLDEGINEETLSEREKSLDGPTENGLWPPKVRPVEDPAEKTFDPPKDFTIDQPPQYDSDQPRDLTIDRSPRGGSGSPEALASDRTPRHDTAPSKGQLPRVAPAPGHKKPTKKVQLDIEGMGKKEKKATPDPPTRSKGRRWREPALAAVLMVLLFGAVWFGYQSMRGQRDEGRKQGVSSEAIPSSRNSQSSAMTGEDHLYSLASFLVPIRIDQAGRERFLKVTLSLAFRDGVPSDEMSRKILLIRSTITDMLLTKNLIDLHSGQGKTALKQDIRDLINTLLTEGTVHRVYFEEFFVL